MAYAIDALGRKLLNKICLSMAKYYRDMQMCMGILYLQRCCCYLDLNLANRHQLWLTLVRRYQGLFLQIRSIDPKAKVQRLLQPRRQLQQQLMQLLQLNGQLRPKQQPELLLGQQLEQLQLLQLTHVQLLPQLQFSFFLPLQQRPSPPQSLIFRLQIVQPQFLTSRPLQQQLLQRQLLRPLSFISRLQLVQPQFLTSRLLQQQPL